MKLGRAGGFTLIEVLIALALFALVSGVAYRGLAAVLDTRERLTVETTKWRDMSAALALVGQAVANSIDRPVREGDGRLSASFAGVEVSRRPDEALMEFTRTGYAGRSGVLTDLQRVSFAFNDGRLDQYLWPELDRAPRSSAMKLTLIDGVQDVRLRFLDRKGVWHPAWPRPDQDEPLPAAVGLSLRLAGGEQLTRIFALP